MGRLAIIEDDGGQQPQPLQPQKNNESASKRLKQGGISDESGYYEGDELQGEDSIEILYDKKNNNKATMASVASASAASISANSGKKVIIFSPCCS